MEFEDYDKLVDDLTSYDDAWTLLYGPMLLNGEAGEVANKVAKLMRDKPNTYGARLKHSGSFVIGESLAVTREDAEDIAYELGDALWGLVRTAHDLGYTFEEVVRMNMEKLRSRQKRGVLKGKGDNR